MNRDGLPVHVSSQRHAAKDVLRTDSDDADILENINSAGYGSSASVPGPRDPLSFTSVPLKAPTLESSLNNSARRAAAYATAVESLDELQTESDINIIDSMYSNRRNNRQRADRGITAESHLTVAAKQVTDGIKAMDALLPKETPYFDRIIIAGEEVHDRERQEVATKFLECLQLRQKFVWMPRVVHTSTYNIRESPDYNPPVYDPNAELPKRANYRYKFINGYAQVFKIDENDTEQLNAPLMYGEESKDDVPVDTPIFTSPSWIDYCEALSYVVRVSTHGPCKSWAHTRLTILETQKRMHSLLNHEVELSQCKTVPHRDFYNVRKIDNHVHHSACMNQKHLLRYIKKKIKSEEAKTEPIIKRDDQVMTLEQVFASLNLTAYDLSIDTLDMHASQTFHRFDKFNLKYNPIGESSLRDIFLKYNNYIQGRYLAEITREVFDDLEVNKYQFAEYRISIYGRQIDEWDKLADWIIDNELFSSNVRWMIQVPRLYAVYRKIGQISNFQDMLTNIFKPLFEVTLDPSTHPKLHTLLQSIIGFDCVDDESIRTRFFDSKDPAPEDWTTTDDPHYCSFLYYLYANLNSLNQLRESCGYSTFTLRPHAGEAGDVEHVACSFLIAHSINHGLTLFKSPPIQYLYYLCQSGISLSPLSNNLLFLEYQKNPFPKYFARGLNVALSTDDPLMIHVTKEPLVEEFSVASQVWKLSSIDICEIATNSVRQSGFEHRFKAHWLGNNFWRRDVNGNDIRCTNVPDIRVQFRYELLYDEHATLASLAGRDPDLGLIDPIF